MRNITVPATDEDPTPVVEFVEEELAQTLMKIFESNDFDEIYDDEDDEDDEE